jgi:hypothetical protein
MDYELFEYGLIFLCCESIHIVSVGVWTMNYLNMV